MSAGWDCEAYGPDVRDVGAVCFVSGELGERVCADLAECHRVMTAERQRVFRRMSELAASGDDAAAFLEAEFSSPEQLLGGVQERDQ